MTLEELRDKTREMANELFRNTNEIACAIQDKVHKSCLEREKKRDLTPSEKRLGYVQRPFDEYDHHRLCSSCAAYWHMEIAAQTLHRVYCLSVRVKAQQAHANTEIL